MSATIYKQLFTGAEWDAIAFAMKDYGDFHGGVDEARLEALCPIAVLAAIQFIDLPDTRHLEQLAFAIVELEAAAPGLDLVKEGAQVL